MKIHRSGTVTTVYRFFDADGELLYVGVGGNPARRFEQHRIGKAWWPEVVTASMDHFAERVDALAAEATAIATESPRYNISEVIEQGPAPVANPGAYVMSSRDAAERLGVAQGTVIRWADTGVLGCRRLPSGHRRFSEADIERVLAEVQA